MNRFLVRLGLGGLGVLNHKSSAVSGEKYFLGSYLNGKSGVVIDVGANEGAYTLEVLASARGVKVFAFEPHPLTFEKLRGVVGSHPEVSPINKGMSSAPGAVQLYDYCDRDGSSHASLYQDVITDLHGAGSAVAHRVAVTTLDEFVVSAAIDRVLLLKIDTEGNEYEVLKGGLHTIAQGKVEAIHFEFNEMNVSSRAFFRDFWNLLEGYRFYRLLPTGMLEIKAYNPLNCEVFAYQNIVAILEG